MDDHDPSEALGLFSGLGTEGTIVLIVMVILLTLVSFFIPRNK